MITVGAFEAKTKLSELLNRVERGEEVLITRHGKNVARLVAGDAVVSAQRKDLSVRLAATRAALAKRLGDDGQPLISPSDITSWIEDGRRR